MTRSVLIRKLMIYFHDGGPRPKGWAKRMGNTVKRNKTELAAMITEIEEHRAGLR